MKSVVLVILISLLIACSSMVSSIKDDQDKVLESNVGYLLLGIETNQDIKSIHITGPTNIIIGHQDLKTGTNFVFTDLPVGKYTIERIKLSRYWSVNFKDEALWEFELSPQSINYVGHLELARASTWFPLTYAELVNRSSEALEMMEDEYPNILADRELFYGGPGEDNFFELLKELEGEINE
jgi:hypothetical protein